MPDIPEPQVPQVLHPDVPADAVSIALLLRALADASPLPESPPYSVPNNYAQMQIRLAHHWSVLVRNAWSCHRLASNAGVCTTVPGQFVIEETIIGKNGVTTGGPQEMVASAPLQAFWAQALTVMPMVRPLTVSPGVARPGATVTVHAQALAGTGVVRLSLVPESDAHSVVALTTGRLVDGAFTWTGHLPPDLAPGTYTVRAVTDADSASAALALTGGQTGAPARAFAR